MIYSFFCFLLSFKFELGIREKNLATPNPLALTAMEFLMQEAAVLLGIQERLQEAPCMP